jgi:hypothetical protein
MRHQVFSPAGPWYVGAPRRLADDHVTRQFVHHTFEPKPITAIALIEPCKLREREDTHDVIEFMQTHAMSWKRSLVSAPPPMWCS